MPAGRLFAILFADLVASTETRARLGVEAGEAWRRRALQALRDALSASRGREIQHTGDGIFAAFESASDAVACGMAMQRRLLRDSERRDAEAPAALRVGIAVGEAREDDEGVHGLVVVEAARLCAAAKPGQVLVSAVVEALAAPGGARFAPVGRLDLKGLPDPVAASEVIWERGNTAIPLTPRLAAAAKGPFVGREAERARLTQVGQAAASGERRLVLLAGEPGIGKTRLAAELCREVHAAGGIALDGRCDEDLTAPFQPWIQALTHFAAHAPVEELRALLAGEAAQVLRILPELRRRLPDLPEPAAIEAESERLRLFESIDALLSDATRAAPIVVLLDDLHWADRASLLLLRHLMRSARPAALLIVGTYRETDLARTHPLTEVLADLRREPRVERVLLRGLAETELASLVAVRAEHEAPPAFVRALHTETEGNPFFAEEVLRHLVESGALRREGQRWTGRPMAELGIPEGIRDVIGRRLSRLSEVANEALRAAAVIGREFDVAVLESVAGLPRDALLDALDEAARARIAREVPGAGGRYAFAHALIRQTLYEELGATRRARLHWRIGEALEQRFAKTLDEHAASIAHHFGEGLLAGDAVRSADAWIRAGERAAALVAHDEARAHFERALSTLDQAGFEDPERRYRAWMGIGEASTFLADGSAFRHAYDEAARIARQSGWPERQARAAIGATYYYETDFPGANARLAQLDAALAAFGTTRSAEYGALLARRTMMASYWASSFEQIESALAEAEQIAERTGDTATRIEVLAARSFLWIGSPFIDERERINLELVERARARHDVNRLMLSLRGLAVNRLARGDRPGYEQRMQEYVNEATRSGSRAMAAWITVWEAAIALIEGRFDETRRLAALARDAIPAESGFVLGYQSQVTAARFEEGRHAELAAGLEAFLATAPRWLQMYRPMHATALAALGREDEARREHDTFERLSLAPTGWAWPVALRHLAEATALLGDAERAGRLERLTAPYAGLLFVSYAGYVIEGSADRAHGQVLATHGRLDEAIARYEAALALEEGFRAPVFAARTRYWLARALAQRGAAGDSARGAAEARRSREAAERLHMRHLAEEAARLASALG